MLILVSLPSLNDCAADAEVLESRPMCEVSIVTLEVPVLISVVGTIQVKLQWQYREV